MNERDDRDDPVFRALADPGRRALLDALFERDGQTLGELCGVLGGLSRFGVAKHLGVLESAGLVVSERHGRSKLHYLNPVPIQRIQTRWISKYAAPFAAALVDLERRVSARTPHEQRDQLPDDHHETGA